MDDDTPELAGFVPHERPIRGARFVLVTRIAVALCLIALVLPGILTTLTTANRTALATCAAYAAYFAPEAVSFSTRFELFSAAGAGWNCYAVNFGGEEVLVASLGLIPGGARLPNAPAENS